MDRPDLFLHGRESFTDILADIRDTLRDLSTSLKKRPRDDETSAKELLDNVYKRFVLSKPSERDVEWFREEYEKLK